MKLIIYTNQIMKEIMVQKPLNFLQVMENQREDLIIIFAGGKDKIDGFFNSNPGVSSRIGNHVDFSMLMI
jgi:hypothetical protein